MCTWHHGCGRKGTGSSCVLDVYHVTGMGLPIGYSLLPMLFSWIIPTAQEQGALSPFYRIFLKTIVGPPSIT